MEDHYNQFEFQPEADPVEEQKPVNTDAEQQESAAEPGYKEPAYQEPQKPKKKRTGLKIVALVLAALVLGGAAGAGITFLITGTFGKPAAEEPKYLFESVPLPEVLETVEGDKTLTPAEVYAANVGSVVGIRTESTPTTNIFGQISSTSSAGSGFVLTDNGYVVTNYHVVEGANTITVTLYSGENYEATLVGGYADNDVALLKIDAENLQHVTVGKTSDLVVGEHIVAIGNPLGELTYTMTVGYVSAMDREINASGKPINMLQTDVAINSGNSGGPVFDMNGNVVAIASAKYSGQTSSGTYIEGLSFAIPFDDVLDILYDLGTYGYVTGRPYLGITVNGLDAATAKTYGLPVGPIIASVDEGSCTQKAGIRQGDIILGIGDKTTESYNELISALRDYKAGDTVRIKIYRGGQELTFDVTLDEKPYVPAEQAVPQQPAPQQEETVPSFGYDDPFGFGFPFDFFFGR